MKVINMIGRRFGRLLVIERVENIGQFTAYLCRCDCGTEKTIRGHTLRNGDSRSCGCMVGKTQQHGMYGTETYRSWASMMARCRPGYEQRRYYYDRGIYVCDGMKTFAGFFSVMGIRSSDTTIDRIDNDGSYTCGKCDECNQNQSVLNCRWADLITQNNNKRNSRKVKV